MIISKTFTKDLLDVMGRAASQLEGDYGAEDRLASELRECCRRLLADGPAKRDLETQAKRRRSTSTTQKLSLIASTRKRNKHGHFA